MPQRLCVIQIDQHLAPRISVTGRIEVAGAWFGGDVKENIADRGRIADLAMRLEEVIATFCRREGMSVITRTMPRRLEGNAWELP